MIIVLTICIVSCSNHEGLSVFWYVTGKQRDIADFYAVIRHISTGEIIFEATIAYNKRNLEVPKALLKESLNNLQLCIIAKQSNHELGIFLESQCILLSKAVHSSDSNKNFYSTSGSVGLWSVSLGSTLLHFPYIVAVVYSCTKY